MSLNLISDAWIPVVDCNGARGVIAPWQMADPDLVRTDWPRPDLDIACLELLIGLVRLSDPPVDDDDWEARQIPKSERLRGRLAPFSDAFELLGDGPRFMQELGGLEAEVRPPGALFIDSGGDGGTLMVREARYGALDLPTAAMALFTIQTQAPSGGRGNLTSLRGGGPMITLVDPGQGLWPLIWTNVPAGEPTAPNILPWMRPTISSEGGRQYFPHQGHPAEVFFGMPRRLRLVSEGDSVTGVMQRPAGTKYAGWRHPLTPYYRVKPGDDPLPVRPRAGLFGYRNWLGIVAAMPEGELRERARMVDEWDERGDRKRAQVIVAGWAMENMKARDFILSRAPLVDLDEERALCLAGIIEVAELLASVMRGALAPVLAEGEAREAAREAFFVRTQGAFEKRLADLVALPAEPEVFESARVGLVRSWLDDMRRAALTIFEELALPGLADRPTVEQVRIVKAHAALVAAFAGRTTQGRKAWGKLILDPPAPRGKEAA